jgi:transposase-like protein
MPKHKSKDYKLSAVKYYLEDKDTQINTCNIFKCSPRSLMRWVRKYKLEHSIKRHNRYPVAYKVKKTHIKYILGEIKNNKTITMQELLTNIKNKFKDINISMMHLHRIIRQNHITLKTRRL